MPHHARARRAAYRLERCAVCDLHRAELARLRCAFEHHTQHEHCPAHYALYVVHLRQKQRRYRLGEAAAEPLSALEVSVIERASRLDLSWLPLGEALPNLHLCDRK